MAHACNLVLGKQGQENQRSLRPIPAAEQVPGKPGLHETLSLYEKKKNQASRIIHGYLFDQLISPNHLKEKEPTITHTTSVCLIFLCSLLNYFINTELVL